MIKSLSNKNISIAETIFSVFQASYSVEAKLLNASDFPPLKRPLEDYINCSTAFFGYYFGDELAGIVEINETDQFTHINSLVVHPSHFRRGIGKSLMQFVLKEYNSKRFVVETGLGNRPAIKLYQSFDFKEVNQWDTDHGVRKVKFELKKG